MPENKSKIVEIFTDGACSGNPGVGGYGAILRYGDKEKEISGCELLTTNNRMEMRAVIESLKRLRKPQKVRVVTDSEYVVKGITKWIFTWIKNDWKNAQKQPVLNRDLWEALFDLSRRHDIEWRWIRGHQGHRENERCDRLARDAIAQCRGGRSGG